MIWKARFTLWLTSQPISPKRVSNQTVIWQGFYTGYRFCLNFSRFSRVVSDTRHHCQEADDLVCRPGFEPNSNLPDLLKGRVAAVTGNIKLSLGLGLDPDVISKTSTPNLLLCFSGLCLKLNEQMNEQTDKLLYLYWILSLPQHSRPSSGKHCGTPLKRQFRNTSRAHVTVWEPLHVRMIIQCRCCLIWRTIGLLI